MDIITRGLHTGTIPGSARTSLQADLDYRLRELLQVLDRHQADEQPSDRERHLLQIALDLAVAAYGLDAAATESAHYDVKALDPDEPTTLDGEPVSYERIIPLIESDRKTAQERWTVQAPRLYHAHMGLNEQS